MPAPRNIAPQQKRISMTDIPGYSLLGRVNSPEDLRTLPAAELPHLAVELRRYLIETLGRIGGHFAANLGTVELTLALHRCLSTPVDRLGGGGRPQAVTPQNPPR